MFYLFTFFLIADKSLASFFAPQAMRYLQESGENTFVAPMTTWPQLAHWLEPDINTHPIVHAVYGPTELLLYGVRFLILSFDWSAGTFTYVEHSAILKACGLSGERFFEACVLAGFEGQSSTIVPSSAASSGAGANNLSASATFQSYLDVRAASKGDTASLFGGPETPKSMAFNRAAASVRLTLIIDLKADTRPFHREYIGNASMVGSPTLDIKMPESIYWMLSNGVISSQIINAYLSGAILETTPLVDCPEYHKLLNDLVVMRSRSISLFAQAQQDSARSVSTYRWYEPNTAVPVPHTNFKSFAKAAGSRTFVSASEIEGEAKRRDISAPSPGSSVLSPTLLEQINIPFIFSALEHNKSAQTPPPPSPNQTISPHEIQASAIALSLELYQYVGMGRSISDLGNALKVSAPQHAAESFIFLELLRSSHLHGLPLHPSTPSADNDPELSLISRVFSLISMNLTEKWAGPIDRELMAFNSIVRAVYRTARNIVEMSLLAITQAGRHTFPGEYPAISRRLPFFQEANTALGVVVSSFLVEDYADFKNRFTKLSSLKEDLLRGYAFWKDIEKMIDILSNGKASNKAYLTPELVELFKSSSKRLETAFSSLD